MVGRATAITSEQKYGSCIAYAHLVSVQMYVVLRQDEWAANEIADIVEDLRRRISVEYTPRSILVDKVDP